MYRKVYWKVYVYESVCKWTVKCMKRMKMYRKVYWKVYVYESVCKWTVKCMKCMKVYRKVYEVYESVS